MITDNQFFLAGNRVGILLIHGLTGTPNEMRGLARSFHQKGYSVLAVQLAGHCGDVEDLVNTRWQDWLHSVEVAAEQLKQHVDQLFVAGLSMGALLALRYASLHPVDGVICYSPTFRYDGWSVPRWGQLFGPAILFTTYHLNICRGRTFDEAEPFGIKNEALRRRISAAMHGGDSSEAGLPGNPWHSLYQLRCLSKSTRQHLKDITAPVLCLHAYDDDVAHRCNSQLIADQVSGETQLVWLYNSYHMITLDNDRKQVIDTSIDFIEKYQTQTSIEQATEQPDSIPTDNNNLQAGCL